MFDKDELESSSFIRADANEGDTPALKPPMTNFDLTISTVHFPLCYKRSDLKFLASHLKDPLDLCFRPSIERCGEGLRCRQLTTIDLEIY